MNQKYDVIVVGAGLAGLTCGAFLSRSGYKPLILEQGSKTGGLVNTFWRQGFAFDAGIRAFENSGIIFPMLESLGIELDVINNPVSIGIDQNWTRLKSRDSLLDYGKMLSELFPKDQKAIKEIIQGIDQVMGYMDVLYGIDNPLFRDDFKDAAYLTKTFLPWAFKYMLKIGKIGKLNEPVNDYLARYTNNKALVDMITQHFFKETPTFFALSYFGLYLDYSYPLGGMGTLAEKLTEYIKTKGGYIKTHSAVNGMDSVNRILTTSQGETFDYKKLVWAADQKYLYTSLRAEPTAALEKQDRLVTQAKGGDSVLTLYLGVDLDRNYFMERSGNHAFYIPSLKGLSSLENWRSKDPKNREELKAWLKEYLEKTTYEISVPALRDPSLAPEGKTGVIVSTLFDYDFVGLFDKAGEYKEFKKLCSQQILETLDQSIFPGIIEKVIYKNCASPLTIERETGNSGGAITGWSFTGDELPSESRFIQIARSSQTPIPHVYQCGQWTFSPSGLPVSILTGKMAADEVDKSLKKVRR